MKIIQMDLGEKKGTFWLYYFTYNQGSQKLTLRLKGFSTKPTTFNDPADLGERTYFLEGANFLVFARVVDEQGLTETILAYLKNRKEIPTPGKEGQKTAFFANAALVEFPLNESPAPV